MIVRAFASRRKTSLLKRASDKMMCPKKKRCYKYIYRRPTEHSAHMCKPLETRLDSSIKRSRDSELVFAGLFSLDRDYSFRFRT